MLDGRLLVDAHVHVTRLATLSADWHRWAQTFATGVPIDELFDEAGAPKPATRRGYSACARGGLDPGFRRNRDWPHGPI